MTLLLLAALIFAAWVLSLYVAPVRRVPALPGQARGHARQQQAASRQVP
jgi:hypothetical protein